MRISLDWPSVHPLLPSGPIRLWSGVRQVSRYVTETATVSSPGCPARQPALVPCRALHREASG